MSIAIRPLRAADLDAMIALGRAAGLPHRPAGRDRPEALAAQIESAGGLFLGAFTLGVLTSPAGELVGTVLGSVDGRQKGWVNRLAVHPELRRRGIARRLLAEVEARLVARGALLFTALVEARNATSLAVFHAAGYEENRDVVYVRKPVSPQA